jgi:hypothetical protein
MTWIRPGSSLLIAFEDIDILAVGCVTGGGAITLD